LKRAMQTKTESNRPQVQGSEVQGSGLGKVNKRKATLNAEL
jgi:hypothetical protein